MPRRFTVKPSPPYLRGGPLQWPISPQAGAQGASTHPSPTSCEPLPTSKPHPARPENFSPIAILKFQKLNMKAPDRSLPLPLLVTHTCRLPSELQSFHPTVTLKRLDVELTKTGEERQINKYVHSGAIFLQLGVG